MEKRTMHSLDLTSSNIEKLAELFPTVITESRDADGNPIRAVDFDALRQELSDHLVDGPQERYRLDWPGKRAAAFAANAPIAKTLRPVREESVDFDTTKNLFIEGDNLEALKLLQESYLGKVKLIYIDPPYNTGKDFVYKDDFAETSAGYLERTGQTDDEGVRLVSNAESNGRFHSDWLSMMYPRLKLARNLLRQDGVLCVSIDDAEQAAVRSLLNEILGEHNFVAQVVWEKGRKNDARYFSTGHEYIIVYAKSLTYLKETGVVWREEKPGAREIWTEYLRLRGIYAEDDRAIESALTQWFSDLPKGNPSKKWARYHRVDADGPWRDRDISWPGGDGPKYDVIHPKTGLPCKVPERGWIYSDPEEMRRQITRGSVVFRDDHNEPPFRKAHLRPTSESITGSSGDDSHEAGLATQVRGTYFYKQAQSSVKYLRDLMGDKVFSNPKDHLELSRLFEYVTGGRDGIILDFFAGSGSTADAVFDLNMRTGSSYQFVLVQLAEELTANLQTSSGSARRTIENAIQLARDRGKRAVLSELARMRLRAAGKRVLAEVPARHGMLDVGFRALRVDSTNMIDIFQTPDDTDQPTLSGLEDGVKPDRTGEDLLFQVLLDWGLELSLRIVVEEIDGHETFNVDDGAMIACFDASVELTVVGDIAGRRPLRAVFRDSAFASDDARINAEQIFREVSPDTDMRVI